MTPRRSFAWLGGVAGTLFVLVVPAGAGAQLFSPKKTAATVNGEAIRLDEVDAIIKQRPPIGAPLTTGQLRQMRLEILGDLIDAALLRQFAKQNGPKIDPAEVNKEMDELKAAQKAQGKTLADFLHETNQTEDQLRADVTARRQITKYLEAQVSDEQVKKYYEANKDFFDKVTLRASHIVLRVPANAPPQERQETLKKLQALRAEIVGGKIDFAEAARRYSQCPSAPKGGDLGEVYRKFQVDESFARAAFALKVGEVSDVVETEFGYHLIKVAERKPGAPSTYELAAKDARACYLTEMREALMVQLRKSAKIEITLP